MPNPTQTIDPVTLKLTNTTHADAQANNVRVAPLSIEESYQANKSLLGDMSLEDYAENVYRPVYEQNTFQTDSSYLNQATSGKTNSLAYISFDPRQSYMIHPKVFGVKDQDFKIEHNENSRPSQVGTFYNFYGSPIQTMTAEEIAESKNFYVDQEGNQKSLNDYRSMDLFGNPFRYDLETNKGKNLVLDANTNTWVEADSDAVLDSYKRRSIFGPKKAESGILENMGVQSYNTIVDQTFGSLGTVAEMMGTFTNWVAGNNERNALQKWGAEMQNYTGGIRSKVSEAVESEGMFGSWRAGLGTASAALTQVASQFLVGRLSGVFAAPLATMAQTNKLAKLTYNGLSGMPWAFGAAYAMNGMNEEAKSAGLDDKSRFMMSLMAGAAVYASEYGLKAMGMSGLADGFSDDITGVAMRKAFKENQAKIAREVAEEVAKGLDEDAAKALMKNKIDDLVTKTYKELGIDLAAPVNKGVKDKIINGLYNLQHSDKPTGFVQRMLAGTIAGTEEGVEEVFEGGINSWSKYIYNENFANPNAEPGKGKFQNTKWEDPLGEFAAGFIGGSVMGAIRGLRKKVDLKDFGVADLALNMSLEDGKKFLLTMHKQGLLGNPLLDKDNQYISSLPVDQQAKAKSLNDMALETLNAELEQAHNIIQTTGLKSSDKIKQLMGGDMNFMRDTLANMMMAKRLQLEITDLENKLKQVEDPNSAEAVAIQNQIAETKELLDNKNKLTGEALSGVAVDKYKALMLVRSLKIMNDANNKLGSIDKGTKLTNEVLDETYGKSINELEKSDNNWNNKTAALETIKNIQELEKKRLERKKEIEAAKNESKSIDDKINSLNWETMSYDDALNAVKEMENHMFNADPAQKKKAVRSQHTSTLQNFRNKIQQLQEEENNKLFSGKIQELYNTEREKLIKQTGKAESDLTAKELAEIDIKAKTNTINEVKVNNNNQDDPDFDVELNDEYTSKKDVQNNLNNLNDLSNRLNDIDSELYDDTDSYIVQNSKNQVVNGEQVETPLSTIQKNINTPNQFTKTNADGKIENISEEDYNKEFTDYVNNNKLSDEDAAKLTEFTANNIKYTKSKKTAKNNEITTVTREGKTVEVAANQISQEGRALLDDKDFDSQVSNLYNTALDATQELDQNFFEEAQRLQQELIKEKEDLEIYLMLLNSSKSLSENTKNWLQINSFDVNQNKDLYAYYTDVAYKLSAVTNLLLTISRQQDLRELLFQKYRQSGINQMALVSNQLLTNMPDTPVIVNGVAMKRPSIININSNDAANMNEATIEEVYAALQYWHYYFNTTDKTAFINNFKRFWHTVVDQKVIEGDTYTNNRRDDVEDNWKTDKSADKQGMFTDSIDNYLNFSEFEKGALGENYRQIAYYNILNTIFNVDLGQYVSTMLDNVIDAPGETLYSGAHTSEQLTALLFAVTHIHENDRVNQAKAVNDNEFLQLHRNFKNIMKLGAVETGNIGNLYPFKQLQDGTKEYDGTYIKDNFQLILGLGGVGKTSYIIRSLLEYATDTTHQNKKIVLVAPNQNQLESLKNAAFNAGLKESQYEVILVNDFIDKQHTYQDSLIFIDEVSLLSEQNRAAIYYNGENNIINNKSVDTGKTKSGNDPQEIDDSNTVFILGDEMQAPFDPEKNALMPRMGRYMQHAYVLTQTKRTDIVDIADIQNVFRVEIAKMGRSQLPVMSRVYNYYDDGVERKGVKTNENEDEFWEDAKRVNSMPSFKEGCVIVLNNAGAQKAIAKGIDADKIKILQDLENSPQGADIQEVYVYIPPTNLQPGISSQGKLSFNDYSKYMGTAVGRGVKFVSVYTKGISNQGSRQVSSIDKIQMYKKADDTKKKIDLFNEFNSLNQALNSNVKNNNTGNNNPNTGNSPDNKKPTIIYGNVSNATGVFTFEDQPSSDTAIFEFKQKGNQMSTVYELSFTGKNPEGFMAQRNTFYDGLENISNVEDLKSYNITKPVFTLNEKNELVLVSKGVATPKVVTKSNAELKLELTNKVKNYLSQLGFKPNVTISFTDSNSNSITGVVGKTTHEYQNGILYTTVEIKNKKGGPSSFIKLETTENNITSIVVKQFATEPETDEVQEEFLSAYGNSMPLVDNEIIIKEKTEEISGVNTVVTEQINVNLGNNKTVVLRPGASYRIKTDNGKVIPVTIKSFSKKTIDGKVKYFVKTTTNSEYAVDTFASSLADIDNEYIKNSKDVADKHFTHLFAGQKLFFQNAYVTFSALDLSIDPVDMFYELQTTRFKIIAQAQENGQYIKTKVVVKKAGAVKSTSSKGVTNSDVAYIYELQYMVNDTYYTVAEIPVYNTSTSIYNNYLLDKAKTLLSETDTQKDLYTNVIDSNDAYVQDSFIIGTDNALAGKTVKQNLGINTVIEKMQKFGFKFVSVEQSGTSTFAIFRSGDALSNKHDIKILLESKKLSDSSEENYNAYLNDIIEELKTLNNDSDIISFLDDLTKYGFLGYNESSLTSDFNAKSSYINELIQKNLLADNPGRKTQEGQPYKKIVANPKNPKLWKSNVLTALDIIQKELAKNNYTISFRYAPTARIINGKKVFDPNQFVTALATEIKGPAIIVDISKDKKDGSGLLRSNSKELEAVEYDMTLDEARAEFNRALGIGIEGLEFVTGLLEKENAHGKITRLGKIILNVQNGKVSSIALYHEIAHYAAEFLISENVRKALYEEAALKKGMKVFDYTSLEDRRKAAEYFAEAAERYASERRNLTGISKLMRKFLDWLNRYVIGNIPGFKNLVDKYNYDIYYGKFNALNYDTSIQAEEMPYEELFRSEEFRNFDIVISNTGNREVAIKMADKIGSNAAKHLIRPSLNKRMFKDKSYNFKDAINRIEYEQRLTAMYETDSEGNFVYYPEGHAYAGFPKLRTDINNNPLQITVNEEDIPLFKYVNTLIENDKKVITHNGKTYTGVVLMYYNAKLNKYLPVPSNSLGVMFSDPIDRQYIRKQMYNAYSNFIISTTNEEGEPISIPLVTNSSVDKTNLNLENDYVDYFNLRTAVTSLNDNNLAAILNRYFPNLDIISFLRGDNAAMTEYNIMQKLMEEEDIISRQETAQVNPMNKKSHMLKFILMTTPQYAYQLVNVPDNILNKLNQGEYTDFNELRYDAYQMGFIAVGTGLDNFQMYAYAETDRVINAEKASTVLMDVFNTIQDINEPSVMKFIIALENKINELQTSVNNTNINDLLSNETYNILNSFYTHYFSRKANDMSHTKILAWANTTEENKAKSYDQYKKLFNIQKALNIVTDNDLLSQDEFYEFLMNRVRHSNKIINSIVSYFGSMSTDEYIRGIIKGSDENTRALIKTLNNSSEVDKSFELIRTINSNFLTDEQSLDELYVALFNFDGNGARRLDGNNPYFTFESDGIYYKEYNLTEPVKIFDVQNGVISVVNKYTLGDIDLSSMLQKMFKEVFKLDINRKTGKVLALDTKNDDTIGWNNLNKYIAPLLLSTYVFSSDIYKGQEKSKENNIYNSYTEALKNIGDPDYGKTSISRLNSFSEVQADAPGANIIETMVSDIEGDNDLFYHPTGFFNEIDKFAQLLVQVDAGYLIKFDYSVKNVKRFRHTVQDNTGHNLQDGGIAISQAFAQKIRNNQIDENFNHMNGEVLNPFFASTDDNKFVMSMPFIDGIQKSYTGQDISDMSGKNDFDFMIWMFLKDAESTSQSSWRAKNQFVSQFNQGPRTRQRVFELNWNILGYRGSGSTYTNGLLVKQSDGTFKLDSNNILVHLVNSFKIEEKIQVNSINRWVNLISDLNNGKYISGTYTISSNDIIDTTNPDWRTKRDEVYKKVMDYVQTNNNFLVKSNIKGTDTYSVFDFTEFRKGIDYIIIESKTGEKQMYLGHGTTMNNSIRLKDGTIFETPSKILNYENYNKKIKYNIPYGDKTIEVKLSMADIIKATDSNGDVVINANINNKIVPIKLQETVKYKIITKIFNKQLNETQRIAKSFKYNLSKAQLKSQGLTPKDGSNGIKVGKSFNVGWVAHEVAMFLANNYFMKAFEGSYAQELDYKLKENKNVKFNSNSAKRALIHSSTVQKSTYVGNDPQNAFNLDSMDSESFEVTLSEILMPAAIYGVTNVSTNKHSVFDGQGWENPIKTLLRYRGGGSEAGTFNRNGMVKTVGMTVDDTTGESDIYKGAKHVMSYQSMQLMPDERLLFHFMNNPYARKPVEGTIMLMNNIKRYDDVLKTNDSLYQRYLIFELESLYDKAVTSMKSFITKDGLESYVRQAYPEATEDDIAKIVQNLNDSFKNETLYTLHDTLSKLMDTNGDNAYIVQPETQVNFNYAIDKLVDFYTEQRLNNPNYKTDYPYISQFVQDDATKKNKSVRNSMPIMFSTGIGSKDIRPLTKLATSKGEIPNDILSAFTMHLEETGDFNYKLITNTFNETNEGFQLNANKDVSDVDESAITQLMNIILASPANFENGDTELIKNIIADIVKSSLQHFKLNQQRYIDAALSSNPDQYIDENDLLQTYIKQQVKSAMSSIDDGSMLSVILNNENINLNVSEGLKERVYQYLSSEFRKNVVKRKMPGMRLVQAGGNNITLYRYTHSNGEVEAFNLDDAIKYATRVLGVNFSDITKVEQLLNENGFVKSGLKHTIIREGDIPESRLKEYNSLPLEEKTKWLIDNGYALVDRGESVVPAPKFEKYGIPRTTTINQLYRLLLKENGQYKDIRLKGLAANPSENRIQLIKEITDAFNKSGSIVLKQKGNKKGFYVEFAYNDNMVYGDNPYFDSLFFSGMKALISTEQDRINNAITDAHNRLINITKGIKNFEGKYKTNGEYNDKYYSKMSQLLSDDILKSKDVSFMVSELADNYANGLIATMLSSNQALGVRVPSGPGSGFFTEVVQFVNDNSSVGYVNTIKNLIDGSDQDIDQFTMYYLDDTLEDLGYSTEEIAKIKDRWNKKQYGTYVKLEGTSYNNDMSNKNNELVKLLFKYYNNPKNNVFTGSPIDMDALEKTADDNDASFYPYGDYIFNTGQHVLLRRAAFDGKTVGNFANTQKVTTNLASAFWANNSQEELLSNMFDFNMTLEEYANVPGFLEALVNASTDNPKKLTIGRLNINQKNATMVGAMHLAYRPIVDFVLKNPTRFNIPADKVKSMTTQELISRFFIGQAFTDVKNYLNSQDDITKSDRNFETFYSAAFKYYQYLNENFKKNQDEVTETQNNSIRIKQDILNKIKELAPSINISELETLPINDIVKFAFKTSNAQMRIIGELLTKELANYNTENENDINDVENTIDEVFKNDDIIKLLEEQGITNNKLTELKNQQLKNKETYKSLWDLVKQYNSNVYKNKSLEKKVDNKYLEELFMVTKYAMLGEYINDLMPIFNIDQLKITSTYDALKLNRDIKFITGRTNDELLEIYDRYKEAKINNKALSPRQFLENEGLLLSQKQLYDNAHEMFKHRNAEKTADHIENTISFNNEILSYKDQYHSIMDITSMMLSLDHVMEKLRVLQTLDDYEATLFMDKSPVIKNAYLELQDKAGVDFYKENAYREFFGKVHEFFTADFLNTNDAVNRIFNYSMAAIGRANAPLVGQINNAPIPGLRNSQQIMNYILQFPIYFKEHIQPDLIEKAKEGINNNQNKARNESIRFFLENLTVSLKNNLSFIEVNYPLTNSGDFLERMRTGWRNLPTEYRDLMAIYQIAKSGFNYSKGFLSKVMPEEYFEMYSSHLSEMQSRPQGIFLDGRHKDSMLKQIISDPSSSLLRRASVKNVNQKQILTLPLANYGVAKVFKLEADNYRKSRRGRTRFDVTAELLSSDLIHSGKSMSNQTNEFFIPVNSILDINTEIVPVETIIDGVKLEGLTYKAYLYYVLKNNYKQVIQKQVEKILQANRLTVQTATQEQLDAAAKQAKQIVLNTEYLNSLNKTENNRDLTLESVDSATETRADAYKRISNEWVSLLVKGLKAKYTDEGLAALLESLKGKTITSNINNNQFAVNYILSGLFNHALKSNNPVQTLKGLTSLPNDTNSNVAHNLKMSHKRHSNIGITMSRYATEDNVVEINTHKHNAFIQSLFPQFTEETVYSADRQTQEERIAKFIIASFDNKIEEYNNNTDALSKEFYKNVMSATNSNSLDNLVPIFMNNMNKGLDRNENINSRLRRFDMLQKIKDAANNGIKIYDNINDYKIKQVNANVHNYQIGDIIQFSDGTRGVIVELSDPKFKGQDIERKFIGYAGYSYVLDHGYEPNVKVYRATATIERAIGFNNSVRTLESVVNLFHRAVPNVKYKFITAIEANEMGENNTPSFYKNGVVYINTSLADEGVVLHEFAHPFVLSLKESNPDLYNKLKESVLANEEIMNFVRNNYPELRTDEELADEAIPTYLQMRFYKRMWYNQTTEERSAWTDYFTWVQDTFATVTTGNPDMDSSFTELDMQNITLSQIADAILNDFVNGRDLGMKDDVHLKHAMPYTMRASSSSKIKNISMSNIDMVFQSRANLSSDEEALNSISSIVNAIAAQGNIYEGASGTYNFKFNNPAYLVDGKFDPYKHEAAKKEAIKNEVEFYENVDSKMYDFLNIIKDPNIDILDTALNTIFQGWKKRYNLSEMSDSELNALRDKIDKMLLHINYDRFNDDIMSIEQAANHYGITIPTNIKTSALVIVHDKGQAAEAISIITITNRNLNSHGVGDKQILGESYADKDELTKKELKQFRSIGIANTNAEIQAIKNALIGMAFKKANPNIKIKKVGSVRVTGDYQRMLKNMSDVVVPMGKLFKVSHLNKNLERDLYELVNDESLFDPNLYQQETLELLKEYAQTALAQSGDIKDQTKLQEMLDLVAHVSGDNMQVKMRDLTLAVLSRLKYLKYHVFNNDQELLSKSNEYLELSSIYMDLTAYRDINVNKVTAIDYNDKWTATADRWHGKVRTWVFDSIDLAMRKSVSDLQPFQLELNEKVKDLNSLNPMLSYYKDGSHALFKNIFKQIEVTNAKTGLKQMVSSHEIHHDINDPDTAKAIRDKKLSKAELEFGKWLADSLYEEFVQYIMDVERTSIANTTEDTESDIRAKAELIVNTRYKKGMVPVFSQSIGSALNEGKISEAVTKFFETAGSWYGGNLYLDYQQSDSLENENKSRYHELLSPFWNQFNNATTLGSTNRMYLLGLGYDAAGNVVLLNEDRYNNISYNLQNIGLFTMSASSRSRYMNEAINNVNIALDILKAEEQQNGVQVGDIISQLENYVDRQIYGNLPESGKLLAIGAALKMDNLLDGTGRLINMIHLAVNPLLGAKNMSSAALKGFISSVTNALSGVNMFTPEDVAKAITELVTNPKKIEAINRKYQLVNITEKDLINHYTKNMSRKNVTETDFQMIFHWFGDHYTQLIGATAQMIHEGTYDAHDVDGNYDQTKDKRFEGKNGQLLINDIASRQMLENYNLPSDNKLTHAYSQRDENRIKLVTQRYVGELNNNQYKNMISSFALARSVMSLKNWMYNVKQYYWNERNPDVFIGGRKVIDEKVVWDPVMTEGVIQTLFYLANQIKSGDKIELDAYRKRNLVGAGVTIGAIAGMYFLVDLLTSGFDDDDDKRTKEDESLFYGQRLMKILSSPKGYNIQKDKKEINYGQQLLRYVLAGAANENLTYISPYKLFADYAITPGPYRMQIENLVDILYSTFTLPTDMIYKKEGTLSAVDEYIYKLSKSIPYGSNYRLIRNTIQGIIDDYDNTLKNTK